MADRQKTYAEKVAETLIAALEAGTAPWQKPWAPGAADFMPYNPTTGKRYRGINALMLMASGQSDQRWLTYKQAQAEGAQVRKGEHGTPIQYWQFTAQEQRRDEDGRLVIDPSTNKPFVDEVRLERPRVFFATVFNAAQIDGMPPIQPAQAPSWNPVERAEAILAASGADIRHVEGNRAFYSPARDFIQLPNRGQFDDASKYYATALHELGHWTGHPDRLNRDLAHPFGSEGYAREELRAEIASLIVGNETGIGHDPSQHAAYVASWIKVLREDPLEIFRAAADAEKVSTFLIGLGLQYVLAYRLGWLPLDGYGQTAGERLVAVVLPALTLGLFGAAYYTRLVRDEVLGQLPLDYVRTARAKGAGRWRVLVTHVLRNTLLPLVTVVGLDLGALLGGAIVTEKLFRWPGLGQLAVDAVVERDGPVLLGTVLLSSAAIVGANLLVDLSYALLDPRARR